MYTVIRFAYAGGAEAKLIGAGERINQLVPGAFRGIRKAGDGFAVELAADVPWAEHQRELAKFITTAGTAVKDLVADGFRVIVDTAIEPRDYTGKGVAVVALDSGLLSALVDAGIEFELSVYG